MNIRLYGSCKEIGYCLPSCSLCIRINVETERKLAEPRIIRPKRSRGRPPKLFTEEGKRYYQISISYYRTHEEVGTRVVQSGFIDRMEEIGR